MRMKAIDPRSKHMSMAREKKRDEDSKPDDHTLALPARAAAQVTLLWAPPTEGPGRGDIRSFTVVGVFLEGADAPIENTVP